MVTATMDLYGDLPAAVGAAVALDAQDESKTSAVWAKGVVGFTPASTTAAMKPRAAMLPAALSGARHKSPDAAASKAGRGISLAFRPASISRKAQPPSSTVFQSAPPIASAKLESDTPEDSAPRGGLGFVAATTWTQVVTVGKENQPTAMDSASEQSSGAGGQFFQSTYRDEYHPSRPNSYEAYCDERAAKEKLEQVKRGLDRRHKEQEREAKREREQLSKELSEGKALSIAMPISAGRGRGMTVPAWMKKKIEETSSTAASAPTLPRIEIDPTSDQFDDAGRRGGLGFDRSQPRETAPRTFPATSTATQTHPLRDEFGRDISKRQEDHSSSSRSRVGDRESPRRRSRSRSRSRDRYVTSHGEHGRREHRDYHEARSLPPPRAEPRQGRVVLLQNMVGPGEVDSELQEEVKEECSTKYGAVIQCVVHELRGRVDPEEAVRIFVEFAQPSSAAQAVQGLNSRFFGGRRVKAALYDDAKFARLDLTG